MAALLRAISVAFGLAAALLASAGRTSGGAAHWCSASCAAAASGSGHGRAAVSVCATPELLAVQTLAGLSRQQIVAQVLMVGVRSGDDLATALATVRDGAAGNVVLYGTGWSSASSVSRATTAIQSAAMAANNGVAALISGNQEGGEHGTFQAFYGAGFDDIPSALEQGQLPPATLRADAALWGQQLRAAGVNLDLAPVLDVVDRATAHQNGPIGQYDREYGYTPADVATHGLAFIAGMHDAGEAVTAKHFPGLGRVTGNTDFTAENISDPLLTGPGDPNLQPFARAVANGVDAVMVGSATYPAIDAQPAMFSSRIVTGLLRNTFGFTGVVISDDVGAAAAVANVAPADRALRFLAAGGDIVLTVVPSDIPAMSAAILARMQSDPAFLQRVVSAAFHALTLKARYGLLSGCG
jgi:beta-N-acetylhexosaminidase